jgi:hypothetical protein
VVAVPRQQLGAIAGCLQQTNDGSIQRRPRSLNKHKFSTTVTFPELTPALEIMGPGSSHDPPGPSQFTGTKRLPALPDVGHDTKRLCMQPSQLLPENTAFEFSNDPTSWGEFATASNPDFGDATWQYSIEPETEWDNDVLAGVFDGLHSTLNPSAFESDPVLANTMPAQLLETMVQSSSGADRLYHQDETQRMTNTFDLDYFFDNETTTPENISGEPTTKPILSLRF